MTTPDRALRAALTALPLVAILRGLETERAVEIGQVLVDAGWRALEVPLNSPTPFDSIARLVQAFPQALVGAGTVLTRTDVDAVHAAGARLVVAPNFDVQVVRRAVELGMVAVPGVGTATEAFGALSAGAHGLKLFPAEMIPPAAVKALRAVLPAGTLLLPVGGITPDTMRAYRAAGADAFGIGSALFRPGVRTAEVAAAARHFAQAWTATMPP